MLEARLSEAGLFKRLIDAVKDLVTDCSFEFSDEGMKMQAMDASHVSLCVMNLDRDAFESYRCDRVINLGLSLSSLSKILKCSRDDDVLTLKAGEQTDLLTLLFENKAQDKTMDFNIKLMEIEEETLGIPDQKYEARVEMPSAEFAKTIRDLSVLGDTCGIGCTKEAVKFAVEGEIGSANITLRNSEPSIDGKKKGTALSVSSPVELTFALRYLKIFTQATSLASRVNFSMASDVPLVLEYPIIPGVADGDEPEQKGKLCFYLAPKIDDDTQA